MSDSSVFSFDQTSQSSAPILRGEPESVAASVDKYIKAINNTDEKVLIWPSDLPPFHMYLDIFNYARPNLPTSVEGAISNLRDILNNRRANLAPGYAPGSQEMRIKFPIPQEGPKDSMSVKWSVDSFFDFWGMVPGGGSAGVKSVRNMTSLASGTSINRALAVLFVGPNYRGYTFHILFTPRSESESITIRKIIGWLKWGQAPNYGELGGVAGAVFNYPSIFRLQYSENITESGQNVNSTLGQRWQTTSKWQGFKPAVLEKLNVDYVPGGHPALMQNGYPEAIKVSMSFLEIEYWLKEDYDRERRGTWTGPAAPGGGGGTGSGNGPPRTGPTEIDIFVPGDNPRDYFPR